MARFVQIIEFQSSRIDEIEAPPVFRNLDVRWEDAGDAATA